jgi:hypothetical protein
MDAPTCCQLLASNAEHLMAALRWIALDAKSGGEIY